MALTFTINTGYPVIDSGISRKLAGSIAFDSSYPAGGESVTPSALGMSYFDQVWFEPSLGYSFEYDHTNNKIKVFQDAPPVVVEEKHVVSTGYTFTLDYPPAWIMSVATTSTGLIWCKNGTASGTLGTAEFCLTTAITDGNRSTIRCGSNSTFYVTYATQAWNELYDLLVQDESITGSATAVILDNTLMGYGYVTTSAGTSVLVPVCDDDNAATGEVCVDFNTQTGALNDFQGYSGTVFSVTYLAAPTSGFIYNRIVTDEAMSTGVASFSDKPIGCWLLSGAGTVTGSSTDRMIPMDATCTAGLFKILWGYETMATAAVGARAASTPMYGGGATSGKLIDMAYIACTFDEIPTVPLEVRNGANLSNLSGVKFIAYGR